MIPHSIKRTRIRPVLLMFSLLAILLAGGCAPSTHRYPAAVDYEQLDRRMASLRTQGTYGRRGFDEAMWAELELRQREAEAYLLRRALLRNDPGVDILALVGEAEKLIRAEREAIRQQMLEIMARASEYEASQRLSRERQRKATLERFAEFGKYIPDS